MFDQFKELMKLKKKQDELKKIHIEGEEDGITIVMDASMQIVSVKVDHEHFGIDEKVARRMEKAFFNAMKKSSKKAQEVAAEQMKDIMGNFNLPGMGK